MADFLELPETKPPSEYIDAAIYKKTMPKGKHSRLQTHLSNEINQVAESKRLIDSFMSKILLVTVGGSFQPIVTSIGTLHPDRVIFLCSDGDKGSKVQVIGEGTPCEVRRGTEVVERLPNIPTQVELGDRFQPERDLILIQNPDDLSECYRLASTQINALQQESAEYEIIADYTGGTKTMSAALVLASVDCDISLYVTVGTTRENLVRFERGESTRKVSSSWLGNRIRSTENA